MRFLIPKAFFHIDDLRRAWAIFFDSSSSSSLGLSASWASSTGHGDAERDDVLTDPLAMLMLAAVPPSIGDGGIIDGNWTDDFVGLPE